MASEVFSLPFHTPDIAGSLFEFLLYLNYILCLVPVDAFLLMAGDVKQLVAALFAANKCHKYSLYLRIRLIR